MLYSLIFLILNYLFSFNFDFKVLNTYHKVTHTFNFSLHYLIMFFLIIFHMFFIFNQNLNVIFKLGLLSHSFFIQFIKDFIKVILFIFPVLKFSIQHHLNLDFFIKQIFDSFFDFALNYVITMKFHFFYHLNHLKYYLNSFIILVCLDLICHFNFLNFDFLHSMSSVHFTSFL